MSKPVSIKDLEDGKASAFLLKKEVGLIAITLFALINGILIFNEIYLQLLLPLLILITYWFIFRLDFVLFFLWFSRKSVCMLLDMLNFTINI